MLTVNVYQAKANLSYYLDLVQKGKRVILAKRNVPIAEIKLLDETKVKRAIGQSEDIFEVPKSFFKPLPKSVINSFTNPR